MDRFLNKLGRSNQRNAKLPEDPEMNVSGPPKNHPPANVSGLQPRKGSVGLSMPSLKILISAIRAEHWVKNLFVFAPLLFSGRLFDVGYLFKSILAFISFSFVASSVYLINDIFDCKKDRDHPVKRLRPIASGNLKIADAAWLTFIFLIMGLSIAFTINWKFVLIILGYFLLNMLYSGYLKNQVILDVLVLSMFYALRVVSGGFAISVYISNWLLICTFLLALFMGFGKRRSELVLLKDDAENHRKTLSEYSPRFLDQTIAVITPTTLAVYTLYVMSRETIDKLHTDKLLFTIPFVLYGIFRYIYLIYQREEGGNPTNLMLVDKPLILTVAGWALTVLIVLYLR